MNSAGLLGESGLPGVLSGLNLSTIVNLWLSMTFGVVPVLVHLNSNMVNTTFVLALGVIQPSLA